MKIYPATLTTLALCHDWTTAKDIAEQRGVEHNGIHTILTRMCKAGYLERRQVRIATGFIARTWWYEYKITPAGERAVHPALYEPLPEKVVAPVVNAFNWRTFEQPVPMKASKWEQQPRPDQAVNTRFTQYS